MTSAKRPDPATAAAIEIAVRIREDVEKLLEVQALNGVRQGIATVCNRLDEVSATIKAAPAHDRETELILAAQAAILDYCVQHFRLANHEIPIELPKL